MTQFIKVRIKNYLLCQIAGARQVIQSFLDFNLWNYYFCKTTLINVILLRW
jgi:hypothetical protein